METKAIIELIDEAISLNLEAIKSVSKNIDNATVVQKTVYIYSRYDIIVLVSK